MYKIIKYKLLCQLINFIELVLIVMLNIYKIIIFNCINYIKLKFKILKNQNVKKYQIKYNKKLIPIHKIYHHHYNNNNNTNNKHN